MRLFKQLYRMIWSNLRIVLLIMSTSKNSYKKAWVSVINY